MTFLNILISKPSEMQYLIIGARNRVDHVTSQSRLGFKGGA